MGAQLLYSTNVWLKYAIQQKYRKDVHYVWCSELFDSAKASTYSLGSLVPPSSNPADIYRALKRDVQGQDRHSEKIAKQRGTLASLAVEWAAAGEITNDEKEEIVYMVKTASFEMWRPLLYLIARGGDIVPPRLELIAPEKRAGHGPEYVIRDLKGTEFEIVEF